MILKEILSSVLTEEQMENVARELELNLERLQSEYAEFSSKDFYSNHVIKFASFLKEEIDDINKRVVTIDISNKTESMFNIAIENLSIGELESLQKRIKEFLK